MIYHYDIKFDDGTTTHLKSSRLFTHAVIVKDNATQTAKYKRNPWGVYKTSGTLQGAEAGARQARKATGENAFEQVKIIPLEARPGDKPPFLLR